MRHFTKQVVQLALRSFMCHPSGFRQFFRIDEFFSRLYPATPGSVLFLFVSVGTVTRQGDGVQWQATQKMASRFSALFFSYFYAVSSESASIY